MNRSIPDLIKSKIFVVLMLFQTTTFSQTNDEYCQNIHLPEGWFIFSYHVQVANNDLDALIDPIKDQTLIIKDEQGEAYLKEWGFNGIESLDINKGYPDQIKFT